MKASFSAASAAVEAFHSPCWLHCIGLLSGIGLISKPNAAFKKCISPSFPSFVSLFATVLSHLSIFTSHLVPLPLRAVYNPIFIMLFFLSPHMTPFADFSLLFSIIFCQTPSFCHLCLFGTMKIMCDVKMRDKFNATDESVTTVCKQDSKYESFIYMLLRSWNTSAGIDGLTSTS